MEPFTSIGLLTAQLRQLPLPALVAVEGFMSSGKSTMANALASQLGGVAIHTDEYVLPEDESLPYAQRLNYGALASSVAQATCAMQVVVLEGICLREVLRLSSLSAGVFVYVKRIAANGLWHDGFHLEDFESSVEQARDEPEHSDLMYHATARPHENADFTFHRIEPA